MLGNIFCVTVLLMCKIASLLVNLPSQFQCNRLLPWAQVDCGVLCTLFQHTEARKATPHATAFTIFKVNTSKHKMVPDWLCQSIFSLWDECESNTVCLNSQKYSGLYEAITTGKGNACLSFVRMSACCPERTAYAHKTSRIWLPITTANYCVSMVLMLRTIYAKKSVCKCNTKKSPWAPSNKLPPLHNNVSQKACAIS